MSTASLSFRPARALLFPILFGIIMPSVLSAQEDERSIDTWVKVRASALYFYGEAPASFDYVPSGSLGVHFSATKDFGKWTAETGIGADRITFAHRSTSFPHSAVDEVVALRMHYFAVQVALMVHYKVSDRARVSTGLNLIGANLNAYSISTSSSAEGASGFQSSPGSFPGFQYTAEVHTGITYELSERLLLAAHAHVSLRPMDGIDMQFSSDEADTGVESFEYSWFRTGVELIYRLNR